MIEIFDEAINNFPNRWMKQWVEKGSKIIGYTCSYIPEEIIDSLDVLPIRLRPVGAINTGSADGCMSRLNCSYCRLMLDFALDNKLNFLEGIVSYNSCDHVRRLYDNLKWQVKLPFYYFMSIPHVADEDAIQWFKNEILDFKNYLEHHFDKKINDSDLTSAIKVYNEFRTLSQQLNALRKLEEPPISGEEVLKANIASIAMKKSQYNEYLRQFLKNCENNTRISNKIRIMVAGSQMDNIEFIRLIENLGGLVVTDFDCYGTKYYEGLVRENGDPYYEIAKRYLRKIPCPRMIDNVTGYEKRLEHLKNLIKEFRVDGVIFQKLVMCDYHAGDNYLFNRDLKELGVPTLSLDREYNLAGVGQLRTRIQAFMEMLS